ncbi:TerD family protein [Streptomyces sp. NPDC020379]|uniref:TerD family protein n=1 Tax=Streptomyces sp. NPDC020379 TaxID=3365071 RepID=UPI0037B90654
MNGLNKGIEKVEVTLKWDPSPPGTPATDLDLIAATYPATAPYGSPAYLVYFGSRAPDGTITLSRDSRTGQGLGTDEAMTLELDRLSDEYGRVVVGVAIQQNAGRKTFGEVANTGIRITEDRSVLAAEDLTAVAAFTAATVGEFIRDSSGAWAFRNVLRGFDADPTAFAAMMGRR